MNTLRYILGVLLVVGLPPGVAWWFVVHPFVGFWRKVGARGAMIVMLIFFAASVAGLATVRDTLLGPDLGLRWPLVVLGVALAAAAIFVGAKRKKYLTIRILAGVPEVETDAEKRGKLLEEGPYALIRHPRYVEIALATFGYAAIANYVGCWILAILTIPVIHLVVILEERELSDRFGDAYREYAARVPRYIPRRKS
jgi:protein-S-isoprenylcysteine O-methyltransferase Ste14